MSASVPTARKELAQNAYSRWMGEGGANVTIGEHGAEETTAAVAAADPDAPPIVRGQLDGADITLHDGAVVIAAITSCTNTSNPSVMIGAGLVAKKAVERGLMTKPWVKTSLAPGLARRDRLPRGLGPPALSRPAPVPYRRLRLHHVHREQRPAARPVAALIDEHSLVTAAVLSGNRNFEARVHPQVRANYLASPMLVVAFALAGRVDIDLTREPLGVGTDGKPVFLRDLWPTPAEVRTRWRPAQARAVRAPLWGGVRGR